MIIVKVKSDTVIISSHIKEMLKKKASTHFGNHYIHLKKSHSIFRCFILDGEYISDVASREEERSS